MHAPLFYAVNVQLVYGSTTMSCCALSPKSSRRANLVCPRAFLCGSVFIAQCFDIPQDLSLCVKKNVWHAVDEHFISPDIFSESDLIIMLKRCWSAMIRYRGRWGKLGESSISGYLELYAGNFCFFPFVDPNFCDEKGLAAAILQEYNLEGVLLKKVSGSQGHFGTMEKSILKIDLKKMSDFCFYKLTSRVYFSRWIFRCKVTGPHLKAAFSYFVSM